MPTPRKRFGKKPTLISRFKRSQKQYQAPGVYVEETSIVPPSVRQVPTSVAAFVGYTPKSEYNGKSLVNQPTRITSFAEFEATYCFGDPRDRPQQFRFVNASANSSASPQLSSQGVNWFLETDPSTVFYLNESIRLFFANGGKVAYIVSTGSFASPLKTWQNPNATLANPNISQSQLIAGIASLEFEEEPGIYLCPDAALLPYAENGTFLQELLSQCARTRHAFSIVDVPEGRTSNSSRFNTDIAAFRSRIGTTDLSFAAAYFPYLQTQTIQSHDISGPQLSANNPSSLAALLYDPNQPNSELSSALSSLSENSSTFDPTTERKLEYLSPIYRQAKKLVLEQMNRLPPSGALAGVYSRTDAERGVWKAPANVGLNSVSNLSFRVSHSENAYLNVDPVSGKSINAIRHFNGRGFLVWGARTLAGNDNELRYIPGRRTLIMLRRSCTRALADFAFETNNRATWNSVRQCIEAYLTQLWRQGAFNGATASKAFYVRCGLGETMTQHDLRSNLLVVEFGVALVRPAEFVVSRLIQTVNDITHR